MYPVPRNFRCVEVDRIRPQEREVALAFLRCPDLTLDHVAGAKRETPDLRGRDIDVVRAGDIVDVGRAQEAEPVLENLEHALAVDRHVGLGQPLENGEDQIRLLERAGAVDAEFLGVSQQFGRRPPLQLGQVDGRQGLARRLRLDGLARCVVPRRLLARLVLPRALMVAAALFTGGVLALSVVTGAMIPLLIVPAVAWALVPISLLARLPGRTRLARLPGHVFARLGLRFDRQWRRNRHGLPRSGGAWPAPSEPRARAAETDLLLARRCPQRPRCTRSLAGGRPRLRRGVGAAAGMMPARASPEPGMSSVESVMQRSWMGRGRARQ